MESVLLTPENNRVHLHTRDDIRAVRIDRLVSENEMTFAHYPALALAIIDEANLALWNQELYTYTQPDTPNLATVDWTFAVWESLTMSLETHGEAFDFSIRFYYTINPDEPLSDELP